MHAEEFSGAHFLRKDGLKGLSAHWVASLQIPSLCGMWHCGCCSCMVGFGVQRTSVDPSGSKKSCREPVPWASSAAGERGHWLNSLGAISSQMGLRYQRLDNKRVGILGLVGGD